MISSAKVAGKTKGQKMLGGKPSLKMHEVVKRAPGSRFSFIVHVGSKSSCNAYWLAQAPKERQNLTVQVAKR